MAQHADLDFEHTAAWCADCWDRERQAKMLAEMRRANDLKEQEINMRDQGDWIEPPRQPRPQYIPPMLAPAPKARGGMSIEPRRHTTG